MPTNCPKGKTASFTTGGHFQDPAAFHYSKAIAGSGTVGNEQTLDPFLAAPRKMFPGTSTHAAASPLSAANRGCRRPTSRSGQLWLCNDKRRECPATNALGASYRW